MQQPRFTLNSLVIVVSIFTAITFFITLTVVNLADWSAVNDYFPIEGTDLGILYSDEKPSGIYRGYANSGDLMLEGEFSHDWGIVRYDDRLFLNEYRATDLGFMTSRLVRVDMDTFEEEVLIEDATLRGACRSGELVCIRTEMPPSNFPGTNAFCQLYGMASGLLPIDETTSVIFVDPESGEVVLTLNGDDAEARDFEARYLDRTLEEML